MKILYHHRTQAEDGQAVHIRALIAAFRGLGHEVREVSLVARTATTAKSPAGSGSSRFAWIARAPRFARELAEYGYGPAVRGRLLRAGRGFAPDFLYERYAFGNTAGIGAARLLGKPIVLEVNSPMVLELGRTRGLSFPRMARRIENHVFRSATLVCAVTAVLRDMLVDLGVDGERILVTPNGVDLERYAFEAGARARACAALGVAESGGPVLGFVGYYRDWHRLDLVLEAMAAPQLASARLVLVGEGPVERDLEARAVALGLRSRVHFVGPRAHAEIAPLLPAFDVALVPAINPYASPLKLFEYMAAGLAVIAPDQPNLREVLEHDEDALLVPSGELEPLRAALIRLAGDEPLRGRLGAAARTKVSALDLTWSGNARRVVAAVEALSR